MSSEDKDIFIKSDQKNNISYKKVLASIPKDSYREEHKEKLTDCNKEWRWRFIKINNRLRAEISSYDSKTNKRLYLTTKNIWVECNVSSNYDKLVYKQYFYYT